MAKDKEIAQKCPHCRRSIFATTATVQLGADEKGEWQLFIYKCPACGNFVFHLAYGHPYRAEYGQPVEIIVDKIFMVYPKASSRPAAATEVPGTLAEDYKEACLVLPDSPKASAALSRRCLQNLLRDYAEVKPSVLADEIQELIDRKTLPSHLSDAIDAIRNTGNFAAHPIKSTASGQIIDVEDGEAEWNLDVLESLFDFFFVAPEELKKKREKLNQKLKGAGKKPMK